MSTASLASNNADISAFFGDTKIPTEQLRPRIRAHDVPQDDDGLRTLASSENWAAVAQLAEKLELETANTNHDNNGSDDDDEDEDEEDAAQKNRMKLLKKREQCLRYLLVRVTADIHMFDFDAAEALVNRLGSLDQEKYLYPPVSNNASASSPPQAPSSPRTASPAQNITPMDSKNVSTTVAPTTSSGMTLPILSPTIVQREVSTVPRPRKSIIPFSLRYIAAVIPAYTGNVRKSQVKLYSLLEVCQLHQKASHSEKILWRQREKRVRRSLVCSHFDLGEYSAATRLLNDLADSEPDEVKHLLLMQQLGVMSLHCGNVFLAQEIFSSMDRVEDDATTDDDLDQESKETHEIRKLLSFINQGLLCVFYGKHGDALNIFRAAMGYYPSMDVKTASNKQIAQVMKECVENSSIIAQPYAVSGNGAKSGAARGVTGRSRTGTFSNPGMQTYNSSSKDATVCEVIDNLENMVRANPKLILSLDFVTSNLTLLYNLEGDEVVNKTHRLQNVVEGFKCCSEAIPKMLSGAK